MGAPVESIVMSCVSKIVPLVEEEVVMLLGVKDELIKLQKKMEDIQMLLTDAERKRINDVAINNWLKMLKNIMYDADDIIDLCRIKGEKLLHAKPSMLSSTPAKCRLSCFGCFSSVAIRHEVGKKIKALNERLSEIAHDDLVRTFQSVQYGRSMTAANEQQTSPVVDVDFTGKEVENAAKRLVDEITWNCGERFKFLAITGMGGIGKTTLAQKVYNTQRLADSYSIMIWICISQEFSEVSLLKEVIRNAGGAYGPDQGKAELVRILKDTVAGRHFLLVLDNVWGSNVWTDLLRNPLMSTAAGGCVIVTTRDEDVARGMGARCIHQVERLSDGSSWELLCKKTHLNTEEEIRLRKTGMEIVEKCSGLPLAIKVIAGVLNTKNRSVQEWERVLQSDAWNGGLLPEELRGALYLSYEDLPAHVKPCFLYLSLFPKDYEVTDWHLRAMWVAEGFVKPDGDSLPEDLAEDYYHELIKRNLLEADPRCEDRSECKMHDLLRSLGKELLKDESFYGEPDSLGSASLCTLRRLSISEKEEAAKLPRPNGKHLLLRTLLVLKSPLEIKRSLFRKVPLLRVLILNGKRINTVPDSIGTLIHLRMLNLDDTSIMSLPESIGLLKNLQTLDLRVCLLLNALPVGLTRLCNLRRLELSDTPLIHVPEGLGKLRHLNHLEGFFVRRDGRGDHSHGLQQGWTLEELRPLSELRWLEITRLEGEHPGNYDTVLRDKSRLKYLALACSPQPCNENETPSMIVKTFEKLCPPPQSLETLYIINFYGDRYPAWMLSSSLGVDLCRLEYIHLTNCSRCEQLPPLGLLPSLRYLNVSQASTVVTVGPEFLGGGAMAGSCQTAAFPKLKTLIFQDMAGWEEWSLPDGEKSQLRLMPELTKLYIYSCPKLKALPSGLQRLSEPRSLSINIANASCLSEIRDFRHLPEHLHVYNSNSLERVSNLPALRTLTVSYLPALKHVANLDALEHLKIADFSMERLPAWLLGLLEQWQQLRDRDDELQLTLACSATLVRQCRKGGPEWHIIQRFSYVCAYDEDKTTTLQYNKSPEYYNTYP